MEYLSLLPSESVWGLMFIMALSGGTTLLYGIYMTYEDHDLLEDQERGTVIIIIGIILCAAAAVLFFIWQEAL